MTLSGLLVGIGLGFRSRPTDAKTEHPVRRRILELIRRRLGINEACLEKEIGLKRAAVRYHLKFLVQHDLLLRRPVGRETHYFPPGVDPRKMDQFATANHGRAQNVLREIVKDPGIPQWELAERVKMTRKILRQYLDLLAEQDLVLERRDSRAQRYYPNPGLDGRLREQVLEGPCGESGEPPEARDQRPLRASRPLGERTG